MVLHTDTNKPVVLVTAVGAPPGLNTLRFLHESGKYRLVATDADPMCTGLYHYVESGVKHAVLPKTTETKKYLDAVYGLISEHGISAVIPCVEDEVRIFARYRESISAAGAKVLLPDNEVLRIASNKVLSTKVAEENRISCPQSVTLPQGHDIREIRKILEAFAGTCPLPWIVKPVFGHGMNGVTNVDSLEGALRAVEAADSEVFVQECIPGEAGSMHLIGLLYDGDGRVVRRFSSRSFRTLYGNGGPATAGISIHLPRLIAQTEHLINCIGNWRGPAAVEWMLDPRDARFKYIEINPRLWGYSSLSVGAGARFHECLVELTLGNDLEDDPGFKEGVVMMRTTFDVMFETAPMGVATWAAQ